MGIIYMLTSPSGKKYIGQTIQTLEKRWKQHVDASKRNYKDHCKVLNYAIRKYGENNFKVELLEECCNEEINIKERLYIEKYDTIVPNGMNIKNGGANGNHHDTTKQKISKALKGRIVLDETKLKLSNNKNPNFPMYMLKIPNGYRICNHPMGPERRFINKKLTDDEKYKKAFEYLTILNNLSEPIKTKKTIYPKYVQKHKNGYCVKIPNQKCKYFVSTNISNDDLYKMALNYLNKLNLKE